MQRRQFLAASAVAVAGSVLGPLGFAADNKTAGMPLLRGDIAGPVTLYSEVLVVQSQQAGFHAALQAYGQALQRQRGFLAITLKQMVGDSTMVKNYPPSYKGVLANAYLDGAEAKTLPLFYSLFVRFDSVRHLMSAGAAEQFDQQVMPYLHGVALRDGKPVASPQAMAIYRGVFQTVVAGDRQGIYRSQAELLKFLAHPVDAAGGDLVTVENHVFIADAVMTPFERKVAPLLEVAQQTFQPADAANRIGVAGARDNRRYRKALSTEILRKATPDGDLRAYIMHGVWESVWDHENSHLDPRFQRAAGPVGAMVEVGPVEPFYLTRASVLGA
jgi:hypothetical protein